MRTRAVRWSEGMLVLPHHFQAAQQNYQDSLAAAIDWVTPYGYGIRDLQVDREALRNFEFKVNALQCRLKDGTLISVPQNGFLPKIDLRPLLETNNTLYMFLALPEEIPGRQNAAFDSGQGEHRYVVSNEEWEERNVGGSSRVVETYRLNLQAKTNAELKAPPGFEALPLCRITRSREAGSITEIDELYIPPLLVCEAWTGLRQGILNSLNAQLGAFIKGQADFLRVHGGWNEANQPQMRKAIMKLAAVNQSYPLMTQICEARGVHPFTAYLELCRLLGQLSLMAENWQPPEVPMYDHDNLGPIFYKIKREIENLLREDRGERRLQRFPFIGVNEWMEVALDPTWIRGGFDFFVGVRSNLPAERLELLFSKRWLDWKLGSNRTIMSIYTNAEPGLTLKRISGVHRDLPALADVTYFQIEPRGPYWEQVRESRVLALKVNERYTKGDFVGKEVITVVDPKGTSRDVRLEMFVLQNE